MFTAQSSSVIEWDALMDCMGKLGICEDITNVECLRDLKKRVKVAKLTSLPSRLVPH